MSEQGPYTVVDFQREPPEGFVEYSIEGPTNVDAEFIFPSLAQKRADELNAAHAAGRLSASEQGKELTEEEIERIIAKELPDGHIPRTHRKAFTIGARLALRFVRTHGYLSKTAGEQPSQSSTEGLGVPGAEPPVGLSEGSVPSGPADAALQPPIANEIHLPPDECITIPVNVFNFLHGMADIHGHFFGDVCPPGEFFPQKRYWWRKFLVEVTPHPNAPTDLPVINPPLPSPHPTL